MATKLSVNINKVALIRNSRGGNVPDVLQVALDCEKFGAEGVTVHPRPDQRHITYDDLYVLKKNISTELNIEGNPTDTLLKHIISVKPHQVTLVPDEPSALTSNKGWDIKKNHKFLTEICATLKKEGIRVSIFVDPVENIIKDASQVGADRIELYTEEYAVNYGNSKQDSTLQKYVLCAKIAKEQNLGVNAGHDLNKENLKLFAESVAPLNEVSIGHSLISDALYLGLQNTIQVYKTQLFHFSKN